MINDYIKGKLPHFFKYAKDKTDSQIEKNSCGYIDGFEKLIKNIPLKYSIKNFGKFNYRNLMKNKFIEIDDTIIDEYNKLNRKYHYQIEQKNKENIGHIIKTVKDELLSLEYNENDICDMIVRELFSNKKTPHKRLLWYCFGDIIVKNLKNNIPKNSIQCEKCGERFIPNVSNQKLCDKCGSYQPQETKIIRCSDCGKEVVVDARNMTKTRCDKCQNIRDKELNRIASRERMKKYRNNKKVE